MLGSIDPPSTAEPTPYESSSPPLKEWMVRQKWVFRKLASVRAGSGSCPSAEPFLAPSLSESLPNRTLDPPRIPNHFSGHRGPFRKLSVFDKSGRPNRSGRNLTPPQRKVFAREQVKELRRQGALVSADRQSPGFGCRNRGSDSTGVPKRRSRLSERGTRSVADRTGQTLLRAKLIGEMETIFEEIPGGPHSGT